MHVNNLPKVKAHRVNVNFCIQNLFVDLPRLNMQIAMVSLQQNLVKNLSHKTSIPEIVMGFLEADFTNMSQKTGTLNKNWHL